MINSKKNFFNRFLTLLIVAMALLCSGIMLINKDSIELFAKVEDYTDFTNGNFTTPSGETIANPTGWELTNTKPSNVKAGIIDLSTTVFTEKKEDYNLDYTPNSYDYITSTDSRVLMINSKDNRTNLGYKSNSFKLSNNTYYSISIWANTEYGTNSAYGHIVLKNDKFNSLVSNNFTIQTNGSWKEYVFFVKTNSINELDNCTLELWLGDDIDTQSTGSSQGSKGAILFDTITIKQYDEVSFNDYYTSTEATKNLIDLQNENLNIIENADFEDATTVNGEYKGWTLKSNNSDTDDENLVNGIYDITDESDAYVKNVLKVDTAPTTAEILGNTKALLINSTKDKVSVGYESNAFTLEESSIYKLTIYAKGTFSGNAQITLNEQPFKEDNPYYDKFNENLQKFSLEITSSNSWNQYSFYITTRSYSALNDNDYSFLLKLGLWLGTEDNMTSGYVFFDNITIEKINSSDLTTGSSQSNSTTANFMGENSAEIKDGGFNYITNTDATSSYPFALAHWTLDSTLDEYDRLNGIMNTSANGFNALTNNVNTLISQGKLSNFASNIINPVINASYPNNNILVIGNLVSGKQLYQSSDITLSANNYYTISVKIYTYFLNNANAGIKLVSDNITLGEILNIDTEETWTTYTFNIKTDADEVTANLQLSLGENAQGTGYAFFDNAILTTKTEDYFNSVVTTDKTQKIINLSVEDFTNTSHFVDTNTGLYTPNAWTISTNGASEELIEYGVLNTKNTEYTIPEDENVKSKNILKLSAINTDSYLVYNSKQTKAIAANSYYAISVWINTKNIRYTSEEEGNYGASFFIKDVNGDFKGFYGIDTNNEWTLYTIYVNSSDASNFTLYLSLGNSTDLVTGEALFSTLTFKTITDTEYADGVSVLEDSNIKNVMAIGNTDIVKTDDNNEEETTTNSFNFDFTLASSLITALAIIIALVGFGIRRFNHKKPVKIGKGDYDRSFLVDKLKEQEEKIDKNSAKVEELRQELETIRNDIAKAKAEYKAELEAIENKYIEQVSNVDTILAEVENIKEENEEKIAKIKQANELKANAKLEREEIKKQKKLDYEARRKLLLEKYNLIEKQIELLYQEELELIKEYKLYKKQVKAKKLEIKESKKR